MKKILGMIALSVMVMLPFSSNVNAIGASGALKLAQKAEGYVGQAGTYLSSKKYNDIKDAAAKEAIKALCKNGCGRFTCGKSGTKKKVGQACKKLCPANDIKNCVKKM